MAAHNNYCGKRKTIKPPTYTSTNRTGSPFCDPINTLIRTGVHPTLSRIYPIINTCMWAGLSKPKTLTEIMVTGSVRASCSTLPKDLFQSWTSGPIPVDPILPQIGKANEEPDTPPTADHLYTRQHQGHG